MGTEIVAYCAQPLVENGSPTTPSDTLTFEERAKYTSGLKSHHHSSHKGTAQNIKDLPPGLPRKRSQSIDGATRHRKRSKKKHNKSLRKYKANKAKHRRVSYAHATEEEIDLMEIELRHKEDAIKLLRKQNEYLRKQNENFLSQYGSHFHSSSYGSHHGSHGHEKKTNSLSTSPTVDNASQISYSHSNNTGGGVQTPRTPDAIRIDINAPQSNERLKHIPTKPYSPLTPLTNAQTSIILAFSNHDAHSKDAGAMAAMHRKRSCSVPTRAEYK